MRVCIYGGTELPKTPAAFISELAHTILMSMPAVIVTGGFLAHANAQPRTMSTDAAALSGARRYAREKRIDLMECYEAWVPEPSMDSRPVVEGVRRMSEKDGVTLRVMKGRTPLGRRLAMVAGVDMVVTISGKVHTEVVVEQALEVGVPVLPIPDAGGDSAEMLQKHRAQIAASFGPGALDRCLRSLARSITSDPRKAASAVVGLIGTAKFGKCLVLLPYDKEHNVLYDTAIKPAIEKHMIAVRLDRLPRSDAIYTSFGDAVRTSSAVIADITHLNKNVMYEVGYAHGLGLKPLLYTRHDDRLDRLPVYFRTLNVKRVSQTTTIDMLIDEYLRSFKGVQIG